MGGHLDLDDVAATGDLAMQELLEMRAEIARLRSELEAARADAERYRVIKQNVRKRYGVWWINRISAVTGPTDFEVVVDSARGGK